MTNDRYNLQTIIDHCDDIPDAISQYGEAVKRLPPDATDPDPAVRWKRL